MNTFTDALHQIKIDGVFVQEICLNESFQDAAARFSDIPGTVVLLSGGELDCSRFHILGAYPWLVLTGKNRRLKIQIDSSEWEFTSDPFETVKYIADTFRLTLPAGVIPFSAGFMGYFAYDLKDVIENLPKTSVDDLQLPDIWLAVPSMILVEDKVQDKKMLCIPKRVSAGNQVYEQSLRLFHQKMEERIPNQPEVNGNGDFQSSFTQSEYISAISQIIDYIRSGDVYQVNLSQRFMTEFTGSPFRLFRDLFEINPAPFFSYLHAGNHVIVSTSPERFICQNHRHVETRPIKGTRPRGKTPEQDKKFAEELLASKKDDAELSMIVDLLRNDFGKVCQGGTVRVKTHKRLEAYHNVYHLISIVEGVLEEGKDSLDLIKAAFPGGSITGCPKIRAMEVIDEVEPIRRHIYTGAIGYISFHHTMDLSIAIRTATLINNKILFSVGGGIVYDSTPEDEYQETLHKGKTLLDILKKKSSKQIPEPYVWINGSIKPLKNAMVPLETPGCQYGQGCFETIRVVNGTPLRLDDHIHRFSKSLAAICNIAVPDLTWRDIIRFVLDKNGLCSGVAAVKIIAAKGVREAPPYSDVIAVTARPYVHRLEGKSEQGIHLMTYPHPRQTPLADHKSLNYLYYYLAGKWAKEKGGDESLILNPDGSLSETNSANLLLIKDQSVLVPISDHVLPGIMQQAVCRYLSETGYRIRKAALFTSDIYSADVMMITNSLIGAIPVLSLDGKPLKPKGNLWEMITRAVLGDFFQ